MLLVAPSLKSFYKISGKSIEIRIRFEFKVGANFEVGLVHTLRSVPALKLVQSKFVIGLRSRFVGADFKSVQSMKLVPALR